MTFRPRAGLLRPRSAGTVRTPAVLAAVAGLAGIPLAQDAAVRLLAARTAPVYEQPAGGLLPVGFVEQNDTCTVQDSTKDSAGICWMRVAAARTKGWLHAADLVPPGALDGRSESADAPVNKADRKRRHRFLTDNPQLPRRIKAAVKDGQVCIGMTPEQVVASWGEPFQKGRGFALGLGEYDCWFYRGSAGRVLFVNLVNGSVTGWYRGE